jgi:hypothetical protein
MPATGTSLQLLVRHAYKDGSHSYHYVPAMVNQHHTLANENDAALFNARADSFTHWPPQPTTSWIEESGETDGGD